MVQLLISMVIDDEVKQFIQDILDKDIEKMTRAELERSLLQLISFMAGMIYGVHITKEQIINLIKTR